MHAFDAMMASRCEGQIRQDWDFSPGLRSLSFVTKVNLGVSMSISRALRRGGASEGSDQKMGAAVQRVCELLHTGPDGRA
eukprot:5692772-Pyramimonas_sp.AAC.1